MKHLFLFLLSIFMYCSSFAQTSGNGYRFEYNTAGYRVKRNVPSAGVSYTKPGRGVAEDTLIGAEDNSHNLNSIIVKAYPNPTKDWLYVQNYNWVEGNKGVVTILDIQGKKILEEEVIQSKESLNMASLAPGTYNISYRLNDGKKFTWKVVKL